MSERSLHEPEADRRLDVGSSPGADVVLQPCEGCNELFDEETLMLNCGEEWLCIGCYEACGPSSETRG